MSEPGIVAETLDGWLVVNFAKRQAAVGGAERVRRFRERSKALTGDVTERHLMCGEAVEVDTSSSSSSFSYSGDRDVEEGGDRRSRIIRRDRNPSPCTRKTFQKLVLDKLVHMFYNVRN